MQKVGFLITRLICNMHFTVVNIDNFRIKTCDIFLLLAQDIDCGYRAIDDAVLTSTSNYMF